MIWPLTSAVILTSISGWILPLALTRSTMSLAWTVSVLTTGNSRLPPRTTATTTKAKITPPRIRIAFLFIVGRLWG